jgi:cytoskeletal protein CcmA (bactofilin family)
MVWNKKAEETKPRVSVPPAAPPPPRPEPLASPAPVVRTPAAVPVAAVAPPPVIRHEPPRSPAILGRNVTVKGEIRGSEDLTIDGDVQGSIDLAENRLTIGPNGKVAVDSVKAREIIIMGTLKGSVDATEKVFVRKDAQLVGDVRTAGIVIEDGAYFKGGIDIRKPK